MQHQGTWLGIIVSCCLVVSPFARAETFALKTGERLEGTVVRAVGNTISIRLDSQGMYQCPLNNLDWVAVTDRDGLVIRGTLESWSAGTYLLGTDQGMMSIKDGQVIKEAALSKPSTAASPEIPNEALTQPPEGVSAKPPEEIVSPEPPQAISPSPSDTAVTPNRPVM